VADIRDFGRSGTGQRTAYDAPDDLDRAGRSIFLLHRAADFGSSGGVMRIGRQITNPRSKGI
jgi:hypothetical protein